MSDREQIFSHADVAPLGAQDPCTGDDAGIDGMTAARMGPLAILRFITAFRRTHGDDLRLLSGHPLSGGFQQGDTPTGHGLSSFDGADEYGAAEGGQVFHAAR